MALDKIGIAKRIAQEVKDGMYINLGIGIPTLVANYIPHDLNVVLQSENGLLGIGQFPKEEEVDADLINAGKQTITMRDGSVLFDSAESFAMIRGGHVDLTILGAMEVSENGDISNWKIPGKMVKGMGGAMDLASGSKTLIITMNHTNKDGSPKLVKECALPITAMNAVDIVITDKAVFKIGKSGFELVELMPGVSLEEVEKSTGVEFKNRLG
jgi:3-oxoacid CoA-transferase B subunit